MYRLDGEARAYRGNWRSVAQQSDEVYDDANSGVMWCRTSE